MADELVSTLRRFSRSYTQRIGVLDDHFLGRERPLGPARVLFEIGPDERPVLELRRRLGLDSGYLSRLLRQLEGEGLVAVDTDPDDARRRVARLTDDGRREWEELERRSEALAEDLVQPLSDGQRHRLAEALTTAERILRAATIRFDEVDPASDHAVVAVGRYFGELNDRFPDGFSPVDATDDDLDRLRPPVGTFLVAASDGETVGCGGLQTIDPGVAEIKRMWIAPSWRGLGLGRRLLGRLEQRAADSGHAIARLDTNGVLTEAIAMYRSAGYLETSAYNDNPYAGHWFEKRL